MFFPYITSILLLSFALYGLWHVIRDIIDSWTALRISHPPHISLLIVTQNNEQNIEVMMRYMLQELSSGDIWYEFIIIDYASIDMTPEILDRLFINYPSVKVCHLPAGTSPTINGINLCLGEMIYIMDLVNRMSTESFFSAIDRLKRL